MSVSRRTEIAQLSARIFSQVWNPSGARTGNKVLRQRPIPEHLLTSYYPKSPLSLKEFGSFVELEKNRFKKIGFPVHALRRVSGSICAWSGEPIVDVDEAERVDKITRARRRGKGTPKKGQGKRTTIKKKK